MDLYPAVDVQGGRVARARPGADEPLALAARFATAGATWLHFVDMDRAYGRGENRELARRFLAAAETSVQVGGGLSTVSGIDEMLAWGAARVVLGAAAGADASTVDGLVARFGPDRLAVALDVREGRLAPRGSELRFDIPPLDLARRLFTQGVRIVVHTDVTRDGTLAGPDIPGAAVVAGLGLEVIVSGGVASLDDIRRARAAGLAGVVVGRALYEDRFTLTEALACAG
jgi:phosphoribosylformimino-5-aminoimidazole carboxamide ribotide isomerase